MLNATSRTEHVTTPISTRAIAAVCAVGLGLVLILGAGFAPSAAMHNAAHDTRHSAAFPCH